MVRKILLIAYNGVTALDLVGPMQVFSTASGYSKATTGVALYDLAVASVDGGAVATSTGLHILARPLREIGLEQIDTIIVPGGRPNDNSVFDLGQAVAERRNEGLDVPPELLAHISPLGWAHILLTGEYLWPKGATA